MTHSCIQKRWNGIYELVVDHRRDGGERRFDEIVVQDCCPRRGFRWKDMTKENAKYSLWKVLNSNLLFEHSPNQGKKKKPGKPHLWRRVEPVEVPCEHQKPCSNVTPLEGVQKAKV